MSKLKLIKNLNWGIKLLCEINSKDVVLALIQVLLEIEEPIRVLLSGQQSFELPTGLLIFVTSSIV